MWRRVSCYLNTTFKRNCRLLNCPIDAQVIVLRSRCVINCHFLHVQSVPWRICQLQMLMPFLISSEILHVNATLLNLSLLRSHVCCNLWHNAHTYLSFWLTEFTFCIGCAQASLFWKSPCLHSVAYMIFSQWEDHGSWWVVVLHLKLTVSGHWLHYASLTQKSRQTCGPPRNNILNTVWFVCRNKVSSGPL